MENRQRKVKIGTETGDKLLRCYTRILCYGMNKIADHDKTSITIALFSVTRICSGELLLEQNVISLQIIFSRVCLQGPIYLTGKKDLMIMKICPQLPFQQTRNRYSCWIELVVHAHKWLENNQNFPKILFNSFNFCCWKERVEEGSKEGTVHPSCFLI